MHRDKNLERFVEESPAIITFMRGPECILELCNPMFKKFWGDRQAIGKPVREALPELEGQGWYELFGQVYKSGKSKHGEEAPALVVRNKNKKPEETFFNFACHPYRDKNDVVIGVMLFAHEVTDQVTSRRQAVSSEERYQAFVKNSSEGIWCFELSQPMATKLQPDKQINLMYKYGYLAEANYAMASMYGFDSPDPFIGTPLEALLVREDKKNIDYLQAFIASGYRLSNYESYEKDRHGTGKYFRNSLVGIVEDGKLLRAWGTQQDVTELYKAAKTRKHSEQLESANRLLKSQQEQLLTLHANKDEFISLASHQLRTPATGVKQYLGMLLEGYAGELTGPQRNFVNTAYESNDRQLKIIDDLLNVAHVDADKVALNLSKVDLVKFMESIIAEQSKAIKKRKQTIKLIHRKSRINCIIDKARMRMVLENILDNASKYSFEGTGIKVNISQSPVETSISITDQGVGITKQDIGQLFQKFIRIDNPLSTRVGGTGIGLYWAKRIIDLHKGSVRVKSEIGKGTTFTIVLSSIANTPTPAS